MHRYPLWRATTKVSIDIVSCAEVWNLAIVSAITTASACVDFAIGKDLAPRLLYRRCLEIYLSLLHNRFDALMMTLNIALPHLALVP
jgi:hypothetical protein